MTSKSEYLEVWHDVAVDMRRRSTAIKDNTWVIIAGEKGVGVACRYSNSTRSGLHVVI